MLKEINCNICGSSKYRILNNISITKEDADIGGLSHSFKLVKCTSCGLLYVNPQPLFSAQELGKLYAKDYFNKDYMKFYSAEESKTVQSNEPFVQRLAFIEKHKRQGRILDIGCATGGFLRLARQEGWETYGVEISCYAAEIANTKYNLNVSLGILENAGFQEEYFDVVSASDILEHISNPVNFLKEIHRIIKKDGILYVAIPNAASFYYAFFGLISRFNHKNYFVLPHHLYHFGPKTIRAILNKTGFEIIDLRFSHSRSSSFFTNIFNFHDRVIVIANKS